MRRRLRRETVARIDAERREYGRGGRVLQRAEVIRRGVVCWRRRGRVKVCGFGGACTRENSVVVEVAGVDLPTGVSLDGLMHWFLDLKRREYERRQVRALPPVQIDPADAAETYEVVEA